MEEEEEEKDIEKGKEMCRVWGGGGVGEEGKEWAGWALPLRMGKEGKEWAGWALPVPLKALSFFLYYTYTSTFPLTCRLPQASNVKIRSRLQLFYLIAPTGIQTRGLWP